MIATKKLLSVLFTGAIAASASAADYYVAETGNDNNEGSSEAPFATIDKAIITATSSDDVIHVEPGTYKTGGYASQTEDAKWGPNLKVKLIGTGASRDKVVIQSAGTYRTLRMAANSWLENVTVVGEGTWAADRGGAIEMFGGTVTNCVIRDGKATAKDKQAGGNLYVNADTALVVDCEISGGEGKYHGGSVCLLNGTIRGCTITGGVSYNDGEKYGANIYMENGLVDSCTVSNGDGYEGGEIYMTGGTVTNCTILANGVTRGSGGGIYMTGGTVDDCFIDGTGGTMFWHGGCIYMKNGTVRNTVCTNGVCKAAGSREGGNIYMENGTLENVTLADGQCAQDGGNLRMTGGTATGIVCTDGVAGRSGGNIWVNTGTIRGLTCEDGKATGNGGNVYMNGDATIVGGVIRRGTATSKGGNFYMGNGMLQDLEISGGVLTGNVDYGGGGGNIYWHNGRISRCSITGGKLTGTTEPFGGGITCVNTTTDNVTRLLEDCLLAENENAAIFCNRSFATYNCSFINNVGASVNSWNTNFTLDFANCVIFGNTNSVGETHKWNGNRPVIKNVATDDTSLSNTDGYVAITASDFADYANGDYRPAADGALVDAGVADVRADASDKDLDGNPRVIGKSGKIDIGCYEYQKRELTVRIESVAYSPVWAPSTVTFTHASEHSASSENVVFSYDFGDGSERQTTKEATIAHTYENPGVYTVTITATNACEEEFAEMVYEGRVRVASSTVYVTAGNTSAAFPYDKPETGYASLAAAVDAAYDGYTIYLGEGVYEQTARTAVNKAVVIIGNNANPEKVVLRNTAEATSDSSDRRVMSIENAAAVVSGVTLEGGRTLKRNGGNLTISAGMISNCVIRGGVTTADASAEFGMGGGVAISDSGVVTHCVISNNEVRGTASGKWPQGGAVVFSYGSSGKLRHCLIAGNRWTIESETANGTAGVVYHDSTENAIIENCTVVSNVIDGVCSDASAAGIRCVWKSVVRNSVIAGNVISSGGTDSPSTVYLAFAEGVWKDSLNTCFTDVALPSGNASCKVATVAQMFENPSSGDYRPKIGGALVNRGATFPDVPACDLAGNPRVFGKAIDIGCYECQRKPGVVIVVR